MRIVAVALDIRASGAVVCLCVELGTFGVNECRHDELDVCAGLVEKMADDGTRENSITGQSAGSNQSGADVL